jgi:hypothetical protein
MRNDTHQQEVKMASTDTQDEFIVHLGRFEEAVRDHAILEWQRIAAQKIDEIVVSEFDYQKHKRALTAWVLERLVDKDD